MDDGKRYVFTVIIAVIVMIIFHMACEHHVAKFAIENGYHQTVVEGVKLWVKG